MATIRARKQADGSTRYTAIVRIRRGKTIVYQEYKTFALRTAASSWAKHREVTLEQPGALAGVNHAVRCCAISGNYVGEIEVRKPRVFVDHPENIAPLGLSR